MEKMKLVVSKIQSLKGDVIFNNKTELEAHLATLTDDDFITIEFRQVVPNPKSEAKSVANVTSRLQGHSKKSDIKDQKNLVDYVNFAKQAALDFDFDLGKQFDGVTLQESYIPLFRLNKDFGLDKLGNVVARPSMRPKSNEIILYSFPEGDFPIFRQVKLTTGNYTAHNFDLEGRKSGYIPNFDGKENLITGRKTAEYQEWLNNLFNQYMKPEEANFPIVRELEFTTAE